MFTGLIIETDKQRKCKSKIHFSFSLSFLSPLTSVDKLNLRTRDDTGLKKPSLRPAKLPYQCFEALIKSI